MASRAQFDGCPPFPDDVPTASLSKISLAKLAQDDPKEAEELFRCCRTLGFFLLDLSGDEMGERLMADIDSVLEITKQVMALPKEQKEAYPFTPPGRLFGYKSLGFMKTETKQPDRCEFFMMSQDELSGLAPTPGYPSPIASNIPLFTSFLSDAQPVLQLICRVLSVSFGLPPDTFFAKQSPSSRSGTMIRLIKYPAATSAADRRTSLVPHTDMGTITLLANVLGGLQILPPSEDPDTGTWLHVRPEPNCLIVNMGDAMVQWTAGVLRSNMHRVTFAPGLQTPHDRYSVAYLVRATGNANMHPIQGGLVPDADEGEANDLTASEWEKKKNLALISGKDCAKSTGGRPLKGEE